MPHEHLQQHHAQTTPSKKKAHPKINVGLTAQNLEKKFLQTTELGNGNFSFKIRLP